MQERSGKFTVDLADEMAHSEHH